MAQAEPQPLVPESIHSLANGPEAICGVTGESAPDFEAQVRSSPKAKYNNETDRYVTFEGPLPLTLWAFAKPSNFAYPLSTCMRVYVQGGQTYTERKMRCDASRDACDRAFLEFQELDNRVIGGSAK
jgi:hypothetical protein